MLGLGVAAFLMAADAPPEVAMLWRPRDDATITELLKTASVSEAAYYADLKSGDDKSQATADFNTAATVYSDLYLRYGHYDALRKAIRLFRDAKSHPSVFPERVGATPDESIELDLSEIVDSKEPLFRDKYRVFVVWISNKTGHEIELSGLHLRITDIKGGIHENVDLHSDPALWEKVKTTPHMWDTRFVHKDMEGFGKGAVPAFSVPVATVEVDLEKEGIIEVPYLENLFPDL